MCLLLLTNIFGWIVASFVNWSNFRARKVLLMMNVEFVWSFAIILGNDIAVLDAPPWDMNKPSCTIICQDQFASAVQPSIATNQGYKETKLLSYEKELLPLIWWQILAVQQQHKLFLSSLQTYQQFLLPVKVRYFARNKDPVYNLLQAGTLSQVRYVN